MPTEAPDRRRPEPLTEPVEFLRRVADQLSDLRKLSQHDLRQRTARELRLLAHQINEYGLPPQK